MPAKTDVNPQKRLSLLLRRWVAKIYVYFIQLDTALITWLIAYGLAVSTQRMFGFDSNWLVIGSLVAVVAGIYFAHEIRPLAVRAVSPVELDPIKYDRNRDL